MPNTSPCDIWRRTSKDQVHSPAATQSSRESQFTSPASHVLCEGALGVPSSHVGHSVPLTLESQIAFSPWDPFITVGTGWGLICRIYSPVFSLSAPQRPKHERYLMPLFATTNPLLFSDRGRDGSMLDVVSDALPGGGVHREESAFVCFQSREVSLFWDTRWHSGSERAAPAWLGLFCHCGHRVHWDGGGAPIWFGGYRLATPTFTPSGLLSGASLNFQP